MNSNQAQSFSQITFKRLHATNASMPYGITIQNLLSARVSDSSEGSAIMSIKSYMAVTVESCPECDGKGFCDSPGDGHPSAKIECHWCEGTSRAEVVPGMVEVVARLEAENAELRERIRCLEQALDASIARKSIIGPL